MVQDIEGIYRNLTSVDIESQKRLWDERGKGYYGEYLVFEKLYQNVSGNCKLLMNLQIPVDASHKTEIDLLMIHESGLFVFEVKHYKGTIYGKYTDPTWTQYFRTQENSVFNSPVRQNQYHIQALQRLFPNVPIFSFIVFTNEEVELKVTGWENTDTTVCRLDSIAPYLNQKAGATTFQMSMEQINAVFRQLEPYSPISSAAVPYDGAVLPFDQYTEHIRKNFKTAVAENKNAYEAALQSEKSKYTKKKRTTGITGAAVAVLAIVLAGIVMLGALTKKETAEKEAEQAVSIAKEAQKKAESELAEFQKNFKHVENMNGGDVKLREDFLEVTDLELRPSEDLENTVLFSCGIKVSREAMKRWAAQFAGIVRVVSPESLVEEVREEIRKAADNYGMK